MTDRRRVDTGAPWAATVGYSRAVRVGPLVVVSGTAPVEPDGSVTTPGDAYSQARRCLAIVREALQSLGADVPDVIRTRIYVTDIARWAEIGRAHGELFADVRPATTMVEVRALIHPDMLVEIEADAWAPPDR